MEAEGLQVAINGAYLKDKALSGWASSAIQQLFFVSILFIRLPADGGTHASG
jgi:hypothetical protein